MIIIAFLLDQSEKKLRLSYRHHVSELIKSLVWDFFLSEADGAAIKGSVSRD